MCIYDYPDVDADCSNCIRRGMVCGVKLPGPKTQSETGMLLAGQDPDAEKLKEYMRLFEKFQQIRPDDSPGGN